MPLHLDDRWASHLSRLPENGMGYQVVDVLLRNGEQVRGVVVLNAQEVQWPAGRPQIASHDIVGIEPTQG